MADLLEISRQLLELKGEVAKLTASVNVLKVCTAVGVLPGHPEEVLKLLAQWEDLILKDDQTELVRKKVLDVIEALQQLRKRGASGPDS
jgi:CheY-like chemotaxis protein